MTHPQTWRTPDTAGFDPALGHGLGFDRSDLEYNQRGALSPVQVATVRAEHTKMGAQSRLVAIVMGLFFAGVAIVGVVCAYVEEGAEVAIMVAGVFGAVSAIAVVGNVAHWHRTRRHGPELRLYVVDGLTRRYRVDDESLRIDIGGVTFYVLPSVFEALHDGRYYRIYYVEHRFAHWRRPVSAEALV